MPNTIFDRLAAGRPAPTPEEKAQADPPQKLLDWLQRWPKPTVSSKEIYQYAPRSIRFDRENAINLTEVLVRHGWLTPLQTHRRDWRVWQINRKPIVHPKVAG